MKITAKKLLISFILIGLVGAVSVKMVLSNSVVPKEIRVGTSISQVFTDNNRKLIFYKNEENIQKYKQLNQGKVFRRASDYELEQGRNTKIISFYPGSDKGNSVMIDERGRIFSSIPKHDIRNESFKGWLWWRLDGADNGNIFYCTGDDPEVAKLAHKIRDEVNKPL